MKDCPGGGGGEVRDIAQSPCGRHSFRAMAIASRLLKKQIKEHFIIEDYMCTLLKSDRFFIDVNTVRCFNAKDCFMNV